LLEDIRIIVIAGRAGIERTASHRGIWMEGMRSTNKHGLEDK
jgi:hypothetical protein